MNNHQKNEAAAKKIRKITHIGIGVNLLLSIIKIVVGTLGRSTALIADGIHSISDMATDVAVLIGIHFGSKEADPKHPYGHGRYETFSAGIIALILMLVGFAMIYKGARDINQPLARPGVEVIIVAFISIIVKELLYQATKKVAVKTHSPALYANAWHHRSDALSSVVVVIGVASIILFDFAYGDIIAAMAVGLMIAFVGGGILADCIREFTEVSVDDKTKEQIKQIINSNSSIRQWHKLRTRTVGREVFLDLHILVAPELNISAAHDISESLEKTLHEQLTRPVNITIHIEPDLPELRK
jgi:cation diffusion facilitator family transporter